MRLSQIEKRAELENDADLVIENLRRMASSLSFGSKHAMILGIAVAILAGCLFVRAFQSPIPLKKLNSLKTGMNKDEVRRILGAPRWIDPTGGDWTYTRFLTFGYGQIGFSTNGTFSGYNYEEF